MAEIIDIDEFKKRKEAGKKPQKKPETTLAVFANLLSPDAPEGLRNYLAELENTKTD
jgi:hypothetical protein